MAGTIIVIAVIALLAAVAVRSIYRQKKTGGCWGSCSGCSQKCAYDKTKQNQNPLIRRNNK